MALGKASKTVVVDGNLDVAIKKYKHKQATNGILSECKKREYYVRPGIVKKRKEQEGQRRAARKNNRKNRRDY